MGTVEGQRAAGPPWNDSGQTAVDYVGMTVVVVAVMVAVATTDVGGTIAGSIRTKICQAIGGSNCGQLSSADAEGASDPDYDFRPKLCSKSSVATEEGAEAKAFSFKVGGKYSMKREVFMDDTGYHLKGEKSDGKRYQFTVENGATAGVEAGGKVKIGGKKMDLVDLGAGVEVKNGDTFVFTNKKDADDFQEKVKSLHNSPPAAAAKGFLKFIGGPDLDKDERDAVAKEIKDHRITHEEKSLEGHAGLGLEAEGENSSYGLGGDVKMGGTAQMTHNNFVDPPVVSEARGFELGAKGKANWGRNHGNGQKGEAGISVTGTVTQTRYTKGPDRGKLARIDVTEVITKSGKGGNTFEKGVEGSNGKRKAGRGKHRKPGSVTGSGGGQNGMAEVQTKTTTLAFPTHDKITPQQEQARKQVMASLNGEKKDPQGRSLLSVMFDGIPGKSPDKAKDPYGKLLYDQGIASKTVHEGKSDEHESGFEAKVGVSFGYSASNSRDEQKVKSAEFMGAPEGRNGDRRYKPLSKCTS